MINPISILMKDIYFGYSKSNQLFSGINLSIEQGEIVSLLGPNGCGKSTLLNILAGFLKPTSGQMIFSSNAHSAKPVIVFQELGLFDWKTVKENILLPLIETELTPEEKENRVLDVMRLLGLEEHPHKFPKELSGGLKQRTAIARALVSEPQLLLLDEPFSALDWRTKEELLEELRAILKSRGVSVLIVTHDLDEAIFFSDRIIILDKKIVLDKDVTLPAERVMELKSDPSFIRHKEEVAKVFVSKSSMR
jgi:NitT/TauT family transport system ATP-binding protein